MATLNFNLLGLDRPSVAQRFMMGQQEAQQNILAQQQLAQAQQQNAMARMQMAEYERARKEEDEIRNYFARAQAAGQDITSPEFIRGIYGVSPKTGTTYEQAVAARQKASSEEAARRTKLAADKTTMYRDALVDVRTPADAAKWLQIQAADPDMAGTPVAKTPIMEAVRRIPTDPAAFEQWRSAMAMGMGNFVKENRVEFINLGGGQVPVLRLTGQPAPGVAPLSTQPMPANVVAQKKEIAAAGRPDIKVNAYVPASETAQKEYIDSVRKERDALRNAPDTLKNIQAAKALIPGASAFMGTGGEPLLAAASFLNNRLGFSINTQGVTDATVLRTRLFEGILDNLKKLDSQPSQEQQRVLAEALGNLGTDPQALVQILDRIGETVQDRVSRYNEDVSEAERRNVKFPFKPQIKLPPAAGAGNTVALPDGRVLTFPNAEAASNYKKAVGL